MALVRQLKGIRCPSCIRREGVKVLSCPDAIAKAIEKALLKEDKPISRISDEEPPKKTVKGINYTGPFCPDCSEPLEFAEGCIVCHNCGYSRCS